MLLCCSGKTCHSRFAERIWQPKPQGTIVIVNSPAVTQRVSKRHLWRFSLKTLLILLTLFCIWFGTLANNANRQRRAVEAIERGGGEFLYDYQRKPNSSGVHAVYSHQVERPGPRWLRRIIGDHYFITPLALTIVQQNGIKDDCLAQLDAVPYLESAMFYEVQFHDSDIVHLKNLKNLRSLTFNKGTLSGADGPRRFDFLKQLSKLESLSLIDSQFGNSEAEKLKEMPNLKTLFLYNSAIGDEGLAQLRHLNNLEMLGLGGTKVTDQGIAYISVLPKIKYLSANDTVISDSSIESFAKMSSLRELELYKTHVTREGIGRMRKAMPHCKINGEGGDETSVSGNPFD
jgi:hypothetical protein